MASSDEMVYHMGSKIAMPYFACTKDGASKGRIQRVRSSPQQLQVAHKRPGAYGVEQGEVGNEWLKVAGDM